MNLQSAAQSSGAISAQLPQSVHGAASDGDKKLNTELTVNINPQDFLLKEKLDSKTAEAMAIDKKIESLRSEITPHLKRSEMVEKIIGSKAFLISFCALPMITIFSPMITGAFGNVALGLAIRQAALGLFVAEGASVGAMKFIQHRDNKSINALVSDAEKLKKEKAQIDKEVGNLQSVKDMVDSSQAAEADIVNEDTYVEIDGLKLQKKKLNFMGTGYMRVKDSE